MKSNMNIKKRIFSNLLLGLFLVISTPHIGNSSSLKSCGLFYSSFPNFFFSLNPNIPISRTLAAMIDRSETNPLYNPVLFQEILNSKLSGFDSGFNREQHIPKELKQLAFGPHQAMQKKSWIKFINSISDHVFSEAYWPSILKKSLKDVHTMGMHSLVIWESPQLMVRLFVVPPADHPSATKTEFIRDGEPLRYDPHLDTMDSRFLYHRHRFHLASLTLAGQVNNIRLQVTPDSQGNYSSYQFTSALLNSKGVPGLKKLSQKVNMLASEAEVVLPQNFYFMHAWEIHRVAFIPEGHNRSGWFAALLLEGPDLNKDLAPQPTVFDHSSNDMAYTNGVPNAEKLYKPFEENELRNLLNDLFTHLKENEL